MNSYNKLKLLSDKIFDLKKSIDLIFWSAEITDEDLSQKIDQIITLESLAYEIASSKDLSKLTERVEVNKLSNLEKQEHGFAVSFLQSVSSVRFDLKAEFIRNSLKCRSEFSKLRPGDKFESLQPAFSQMLDALKKAIDSDTSVTGKNRYEKLLKLNKIEISEIDEICISVAPFLKSKLQGIKNPTKNCKPNKINVQRVLEKFLPKDAFTFNKGERFMVFEKEKPIKFVAREKGEDIIPYLFHDIGKAIYSLYSTNNYRDNSLLSPSYDPNMSLTQAFLFSHFLLEEKVIGKAFNCIKNNSFNRCAISSNKFASLTHFMVKFAIEKALINEEIAIENLEDLFKDDMEHYFGVHGSLSSVFDNKHWFFGEFCMYPRYLKAMVFAAQIFHMLKSDGSICNASNAKLKKLTDWLSKNMYNVDQKKPEDSIIETLTGEKLDCRFFKKFE